MSPRLSRAAQSERNRALVLAAAHRVFLERGYHAATLDHIADEAGFSKGVVYSQFESKADLFMALLESRVAERAESNARLVDRLEPGQGLPELLDHLVRADHAVPGWLLLVIEFRALAAREPELNRRYAEVHRRTVGALAGVLETMSERVGTDLPIGPEALAEVMLAIGFGAILEQAANPDALGGPQMAEVVSRVLTSGAVPASAGASEGSATP
jgi:AcrR family transcriptional regulator